MEEMREEITILRNQKAKLKLCFLVAMAILIPVVTLFQAQYSQVCSYYQATEKTNQEILLNLKWQCSELQRSLSMIEALQPD